MATTTLTSTAITPKTAKTTVLEATGRRIRQPRFRPKDVCPFGGNNETASSGTSVVEKLRLSEMQRASLESSTVGDVVSLVLVLAIGASGIAMTAMMAMNFFSIVARFSSMDILRMMAGMP